MPAESPKVSGRVAVVTGSAGGIGAAISRRLAGEGVTVVGVDVLDQSDTAAAIAGHGGSFRAASCDLADASAVAGFARWLERETGRLDILVNNAAIDDAVGIDDLDVERFRRVLAIDLESPFVLTKELLPLLRAASSARVINIGSGAVVNPMRGFVAYRAAKMGLIGLTRALALELGGDGITVNVVSPGVTASPMAEASLTPEFRAATLTRQAIPRTGVPDDIADAVAFLAGEKSAFITGQTIMVNGGAAFV